MLTYCGVLILLAGFYAFTRGCWVGGAWLFAWVGVALLYLLTAMTILNI